MNAGAPARSRCGGRVIATALALAALAGCAQQPVTPAAPAPPPPSPPPVAAPPEPPAPAPPPKPAPADAGDVLRGRVSLYGSDFAGKPTASGEPFDPDALTMAHRTLPFGTRVRVTNLENQRSVVVTVNDRGPFVAGRIADLSLGAAKQIGMVADGVVDAVLEILRRGGAGKP